jgi:hypothetical protein
MINKVQVGRFNEISIRYVDFRGNCDGHPATGNLLGAFAAGDSKDFGAAAHVSDKKARTD